jgi:hypothetical protein
LLSGEVGGVDVEIVSLGGWAVEALHTHIINIIVRSRQKLSERVWVGITRPFGGVEIPDGNELFASLCDKCPSDALPSPGIHEVMLNRVDYLRFVGPCNSLRNAVGHLALLLVEEECAHGVTDSVMGKKSREGRHGTGRFLRQAGIEGEANAVAGSQRTAQTSLQILAIVIPTAIYPTITIAVAGFLPPQLIDRHSAFLAPAYIIIVRTALRWLVPAVDNGEYSDGIDAFGTHTVFLERPVVYQVSVLGGVSCGTRLGLQDCGQQ